MHRSTLKFLLAQQIPAVRSVCARVSTAKKASRAVRAENVLRRYTSSRVYFAPSGVNFSRNSPPQATRPQITCKSCTTPRQAGATDGRAKKQRV